MFFKKKENIEVVADLDKIISDPLHFKLHGNLHKINPVEIADYLAYIHRWQMLTQREKITAKELINEYILILHPICPTISKSDLENCTQQQLSGIFNIIHKSITGEIVEKKTLLAKN